MYKLTEEQIILENEERTVYGIWYDDKYHIHNVSANKDILQHLADNCNKYSLSPMQLHDIAEDFING